MADEKLKVLAGGKSKIEIISIGDVELDTDPRYLIEDLLPHNSMVVVWGPPKCGKSFWVFNLLLHVALGWQYKSKRVEQGAVVYCAFEGQNGIKRRIAAFRQHYRVPLKEDPFKLVLSVLSLVHDHKALIAAIKNSLGDVRPVAVTLDTLNRSLAGSENKDEDMSAYIAAADALREAFSCTVIIVHHCGIKASRPRGHTALTGALDVQIRCKMDDGRIISEVELSKDGPQGETDINVLKEVELGRDKTGKPITSCVIVGAKELLKGHPATALNVLVSLLKKETRGNVSIEKWRESFEAEMQKTETKGDVSKKTLEKAFLRAREKLEGAGFIEISENTVRLL